MGKSWTENHWARLAVSFLIVASLLLALSYVGGRYLLSRKPEAELTPLEFAPRERPPAVAAPERKRRVRPERPTFDDAQE